MTIGRDGHPPSSTAPMSGVGASGAGLNRRCRARSWILVVALVASMVARASAAAQAPARPVRVMLLYGVSPELPDVVSFTKQLRTLVRHDAGRPVEFYPEYLDFDRFPNFGPRLVGYFADKYRGEHIDVVLAIGSAALRFGTQNLRGVLR